MRSPLWIIKTKNKEYYYYDDDEYSKSTIKGETIRAKGLGSLSSKQAHNSMFTEEFQRLDVIRQEEGDFDLLYGLMGDNVEYKKDFVFKNVNFEEIAE